MSGDNLDDIAISNFQEYLRIPSVQPNANYDGCVEFLRKQANELKADFKTIIYVEKKPIVLLTFQGTDASLPAIFLNSHMDVVPVYPELWSHDPFGAEIDDQGNIYARGSQDMKCVGIQYLEAIRRLQKAGRVLKRTIHVSFVPDEEIGGKDGMATFSKSDDFRQLNVGFSLDEGLASEDESFLVYYAERPNWHIRFTIKGTEGHGSLLLPNTCGEKLQKFLDQVIEYRQSQVDILNNNSNLLIGDVTTVNVTMLSGGVEPNVVPPEVSIVLDLRLAIDVNHDEFDNRIKTWTDNAGGGFSLEYILKTPNTDPTAVDDSNPYWVSMRTAFENLNIKYKTTVFPAATDGRYVRQLGLPCIGFSPMNNTPVLLHANDEYLNKNVFLQGIKIYEELISSLASLN